MNIYEDYRSDEERQFFTECELESINIERTLVNLDAIRELRQINMRNAELRFIMESAEPWELETYYEEEDQKTEDNQQGLLKKLWDGIVNLLKKIKNALFGNKDQQPKTGQVEVDGPASKFVEIWNKHKGKIPVVIGSGAVLLGAVTAVKAFLADVDEAKKTPKTVKMKVEDAKKAWEACDDSLNVFQKCIEAVRGFLGLDKNGDGKSNKEQKDQDNGKDCGNFITKALNVIKDWGQKLKNAIFGSSDDDGDNNENDNGEDEELMRTNIPKAVQQAANEAHNQKNFKFKDINKIIKKYADKEKGAWKHSSINSCIAEIKKKAGMELSKEEQASKDKTDKEAVQANQERTKNLGKEQKKKTDEQKQEDKAKVLRASAKDATAKREKNGTSEDWDKLVEDDLKDNADALYKAMQRLDLKANRLDVENKDEIKKKIGIVDDKGKVDKSKLTYDMISKLREKYSLAVPKEKGGEDKWYYTNSTEEDEIDDFDVQAFMEDLEDEYGGDYSDKAILSLFDRL